MSELMHDLRYGARLLRRAPGFTLLAVSVLSLGIGATTGVFSVVDALLLRQLPYPEPDRIALRFEAPAARPAALEPVAPANVMFGIGPMDAWTLAAVCVTLAAVSGIACLLPALRATRVSPMTAMRTE